MSAVGTTPGFQGWLKPPVFASQELTVRARLLHGATWIGMACATVAFAILAIVQPSSALRAIATLVAIDVLGLTVLEVSRRGHPRAGSALAIGSLIVLATALAPSGGGIHSPGATLYIAFVLLAGVLLGPRAALNTALVCALAAAGLVVGEITGHIDTSVEPYGPIGRLIVSLLNMTFVVLLTYVASRSMTDALRRAESELAEKHQAEQRLALALDAAGMGVWEFDQGTKLYRVDARSLSMLGVDAAAGDALTTEQVRAVVHPDDRGLIGELAFLKEDEADTCEFRVVHPDGSVHHIGAFGRGSRVAVAGTVRVIGILMDVTERRQAEIERELLVTSLRERVKELTLLRNVARLLHARVFFDRSVLSQIVRMMPAGWQHVEACEARIRYGDETFATPGWKETPWMQSQSFETNRARGVIEVAYTREFPQADEGPFLDEERALLESLAEMLVGHLESEHIEELRRDLEGQLRQSQKMEALGTLAGGIAHDFNNILTAIGGNVDLALLDARDDGMRDYLKEVKHAHERARDLVKRILVFGRRQESQKNVIDLRPVVEEALGLIRASVGHEIRIETHFQRDLPPVLADSTQMHQVLMNVATNAAYAMRDSGGLLTVTLDERSTTNPIADDMPAELNPGRYIRLAMRDTGVGMTREVRERLFEPFFTTKGVLGTGLGLSVVHGIVHDHGGGICVESEPGRGTLFELYFPAAVEIAETRAPAEAAPAPGSGQRILYVDDEEAVLFVMTRTIERLGYRATGCATPAEALRVFGADPHGFDAVVSDMGMPGMSGLELAKELRRIRPDVPIAIASGYARPQTEAEEVSAWIHKPPSRQELAEMLAHMLAAAE